MVRGAIDINQLSSEINNMLKSYANGVGTDIEAIAAKAAKKAAKMLKTAGTFDDITGSYRTGWRAKKVNGKWVVHNATDYQLTHLLEKGHALANGGRSKKYPHIKPVEEEIIVEFEREIRKVLGK